MVALRRVTFRRDIAALSDQQRVSLTFHRDRKKMVPKGE
jgi:hypothetical protein